MLNLVYKRLRLVHNTLAVILTNVESTRNLKRCTVMLNNLLLGLLLFFAAMLFPFAMFALNLNVWANIVPFLLVIAAFYYIKKLVANIDGNSSFVPSYNAVSFTKF